MNKSFLVLTFIIGIASSAFSQKTLKNGDKWIPADFNPKNTILLVEAWSGIQEEKGISKQEDYMDKMYPYKYEVVPLETIRKREGKYANTKIYKWSLVSTTNVTALTKSNGASTNTGVLTSVDRDFHFYDRENDKNYPETNRSQGPFKQTFQVVINTIAKHIGE
jgi:hypothetical protein